MPCVAFSPRTFAGFSTARAQIAAALWTDGDPDKTWQTCEPLKIGLDDEQRT